MDNIIFPFPVNQNYINPLNAEHDSNNDYIWIVPKYSVAHEVSEPVDVKAMNFINNANRPDAPANFHEIVDKDGVWLALPVKQGKCALGWHVRQHGNQESFGIEMSHYTNKSDFDRTYDIYCARHAYWLLVNDWDITHLKTHHEVTDMYEALDHGTHDDPDSYFAMYGITIPQFKADVQKWMDKLKPMQVQVQANFYRVFADNNKQQGAFSVKANAYKMGWDLFNAGKLDVYLTDPNGTSYEFGKHPDENPNPPVVIPVIAPVSVIEKPVEVPPTPPVVVDIVKHPIIGTSEATVDQMIFLAKGINPDFDESIAHAFLDVSAKYGIRGDIAFCQSIVETGWFKYEGSLITPDMHNYAGIGATSQNVKGNWFATVTEGVTAQIQHLFAYASKSDLPVGETLKDPRFQFVIRGSATNWEDLNNKWAMNNTYADEIFGVYDKLMKVVVPSQTTIEQPEAPVAQVVQVAQQVIPSVTPVTPSNTEPHEVTPSILQPVEDPAPVALDKVAVGKQVLQDLVDAGLIDKDSGLEDRMLNGAENWLILVLISQLRKKGA